MPEAKTFMVEDAQLIFRNFSGEESAFNAKGDRNFSVILDEATAQAMLKDGWNVKYLKQRDDAEEGDAPTPYIPVKVGYKSRPPLVVMITSSGRTNLSEETIGTLDWADIRTVDLIGRGYEWEVNGKAGLKAYLQSMFVTIEEDALMLKYGSQNAE